MANTSIIHHTHPEITFYAFGERLPSGFVSDPKVMETVIASMRTFPTKLVPTTYEAAKVYLDEELLKPKGQRDIPHEMCMLIVSDVPGDQDIVFKANSLDLLIHFKQGDMLFCPTIDLPPTSFGTRKNRYSDMLLDRKTSQRGQALVLMAYFTRAGDNPDYNPDYFKSTKFDNSPYE